MSALAAKQLHLLLDRAGALIVYQEEGTHWVLRTFDYISVISCNAASKEARTEPDTVPIRLSRDRWSMVVSWKTSATDGCFKPFPSSGSISTVPGNRSASFCVVRGMTRTVGILSEVWSFCATTAGRSASCDRI